MLKNWTNRTLFIKYLDSQAIAGSKGGAKPAEKMENANGLLKPRPATLRKKRWWKIIQRRQRLLKNEYLKNRLHPPAARKEEKHPVKKGRKKPEEKEAAEPVEEEQPELENDVNLLLMNRVKEKSNRRPARRWL